MGIEPKHLLDYVINPVLRDLGLWSVPAAQLVLGTACQESQCGRWLHQVGGGPARGVYQCEPDTHDDIWMNYLVFHGALADKVMHWAIGEGDLASELEGNLYYATAMCRVHYYRAPEALPKSLAKQAMLWKLRYNTPLGAGTVEQYIQNWHRFGLTHIRW